MTIDHVRILKAYLRAVKDAEGVSFTGSAELPPELRVELERIEAEVDAERQAEADAMRFPKHD